MNKLRLILSSTLIILSINVYAQKIDLFCTGKVVDEPSSNIKFPISFIPLGAGKYNVIRFDRSVDSKGENFFGKLIYVKINDSFISYEYESFQTSTKNENSKSSSIEGKEIRNGSISRITGEFTEIVNGKGGIYDFLKRDQPYLIKGICEKRAPNKF